MTKEFNNMVEYLKSQGFEHTAFQCVPGDTYIFHTLTNNRGVVMLYEHEGELLFLDYVRK